MVVVVMRNDDSVYCGYVLDVAWSGGVSLRPHEGKGGAAVFEDWVEKDS